MRDFGNNIPVVTNPSTNILPHFITRKRKNCCIFAERKAPRPPKGEEKPPDPLTGRNKRL